MRRKKRKEPPTKGRMGVLAGGCGAELPFMALRHCFGLTRRGASEAEGHPRILMEMVEGRRAGMVCLNCGLGMREILGLSRLGNGWGVQCQAISLRQTSRIHISMTGCDLDHEPRMSVYTAPGLVEALGLATSRQWTGRSFDPDFPGWLLGMLTELDGVPVLLDGMELAIMELPRGFGVA